MECKIKLKSTAYGNILSQLIQLTPQCKKGKYIYIYGRKIPFVEAGTLAKRRSSWVGSLPSTPLNQKGRRTKGPKESRTKVKFQYTKHAPHVQLAGGSKDVAGCKEGREAGCLVTVTVTVTQVH